MNFLDLPEREQIPRDNGLNILIDNGLATQYFCDVISSHSLLIDTVKFGWGTALITKDLEKKIAHLQRNNIRYFFGGTLFEKALVQNKVDEFHQFCLDHKVNHVEISNGTISLSNKEKARYIKEFSKTFNVLSEVGSKDDIKSQQMHPQKWIEYMHEDLEAGASKVITEARESGKSGICRSNGELRYGLIEAILDSNLQLNNIIFEAPNKSLQTYFIQKIGCNVNLANLAFNDIIALETLRLGLRSDTLETFEGTQS